MSNVRASPVRRSPGRLDAGPPAPRPPWPASVQVVLEEGVGRRVIFSTFDPDCATLLSLKQPRYPVLFLTCGGTKLFGDPRMNSLDAALQFALASRLQARRPAGRGGGGAGTLGRARAASPFLRPEPAPTPTHPPTTTQNTHMFANTRTQSAATTPPPHHAVTTHPSPHTASMRCSPPTCRAWWPRSAACWAACMSGWPSSTGTACSCESRALPGWAPKAPTASVQPPVVGPAKQGRSSEVPRRGSTPPRRRGPCLRPGGTQPHPPAASSSGC